MNMAPAIDTLIVVCCHAIYLGKPDLGSTSNNRDLNGSPLNTTSMNSNREITNSQVHINAEDEANWLIEPFQQGEVPTFFQHIRAGLEILSRTDNAILCFSGGATKPTKTEQTEARGYYQAAQDSNWFGLCCKNEAERRVFEEEWATDSYQNILLSLIRWSQWKGLLENASTSRRNTMSSSRQKHDSSECRLDLPLKLIIVSHAFKRKRFMELHLPVIQQSWEESSSTPWSLEEVEFIGIDPPFADNKMREIVEGDRQRGFGVWKEDVRGIGTLLRGKRSGRGWDKAKFMLNASNLYDGQSVGEIDALVA